LRRADVNLSGGDDAESCGDCHEPHHGDMRDGTGDGSLGA